MLTVKQLHSNHTTHLNLLRAHRKVSRHFVPNWACLRSFCFGCIFLGLGGLHCLLPLPPLPTDHSVINTYFLNQILFSFSADKDRRSDSRIRKHSAAPPGIEPRILRILVARSNHWATKPQRELRVNFRLSPSCQFFFHYDVTRIARVYNTQRPTKTRWI